jgi:hypothetical protein
MTPDVGALTGSKPYSGMTDPAVMYAVGTNSQIPTRPEEHIPSDNEKCDRLWTLLVNCWWREPEKRPTARRVHDTVSAQSVVVIYTGV